MAEKILITAALPYANGPLHFGHMAGCYLPADCYARFQRLLGNDVLFLCGSDEYGIAITLSAEMAGKTPQEHVDFYHNLNKGYFDKLHISFDHYSRTTWEGHVPTVHEFFLDLYNNGYIEEQETEQLYSEAENRFLADRYVLGTCPKCGFEEARGDECPKCGGNFEATDLKNPRSKLTNAPLVLKISKHWYLRFDLFKDKLTAWLEEKNWKSNVVHFVQNYIDELKPRAITRDSSWGVPVPLPAAEGKVLYVWFDAPIGYISAAKEWSEKIGDKEAWRRYWQDEKTKLVNFIGKDNIPFHAIFFPAMIMGQKEKYKLVDELPANEFLNLEGRQFSKSSGWFIDLGDFLHKFQADQLRYTLAANAPENHDSEFTWKDFEMRCNAELVGKFGNFAFRVLSFLQNHLNSKVPECKMLKEEDKRFLEELHHLANAAKEAYLGFHLRKASQLIMEASSLGNQYFDSQKPWKLIKDASQVESLHTTMYLCLTALKTLALMSYPIMPQTAEKLWSLLGGKKSLQENGWDNVLQKEIPFGNHLPEPERLFPKIEEKQIQAEVQHLQDAVQKKTASPGPLEPIKEEVDIDDFGSLDLRVGEVAKAEKIKKSNKLLKIEVNLGFETRTIVSGIAKSYLPEDLIGKKVAVIVNLKPTKIMGIESEGMILAASDGKILELPLFEKSAPGSIIS
ncbi:MAG: methionine--tRNA ligase [Simkaniaceae bacterium]